MNLRKWTIPLTLVGLGGLGAMLLSERGRKLIRSGAQRLRATAERRPAWSGSAQEELDHIQQALNELEQSLGCRTAQ